MRFSLRMKETVRQVNNEDFLLGGGEMGALMRSHDWMKTPLGTPHEWPQSSEDGGPPFAYHPASDVHLVGAGADLILQ